jgi:hypothetical protein
MPVEPKLAGGVSEMTMLPAASGVNVAFAPEEPAAMVADVIVPMQ